MKSTDKIPHFRGAVSPKAVAGRASERGSALVGALVLCLFLSAALVVTYDTTLTSTRGVTREGSRAESTAAAEYGVHLAISEISTWSRNEDNVGKDWVQGDIPKEEPKIGLYVNAAGQKAFDQRRLSGVFGGQEFRVKVRSVDLAKEETSKPNGWLWTPEKGDNVYEITGAARSANLSRLDPERQTDAAVQTVVSINFKDYWGDGQNAAPLVASLPQNVQMTMGENIVVSGEDHDINKYYVEKFESERIVTPLKLTTTTANYFGARGTYWTSGFLTLNYRLDPEGEVNPHRPMTTTFGDGNNRVMIQRIGSQEPDTYLLGGKQGKTVTLDDSGMIKETNTNQANAGGNFNVVLGQFEDLMNLYINMAGVWGAVTDPTQWFQQYIGQYSQNARSSTLAASSFPIYAGTKVRAQTIHLLKNDKDQVLVREFEKTKNGPFYPYQASGTHWRGNYTWAKMNDMGNTVTSAEPTSKNQRIVPRVFMWQELVGYSLEKRGGAGSDKNEPLLRTPGVNSADKRTFFHLDEQGNRVKVGFDELYQTNNGAGSLQDRFDPIPVRQADGTLKDCYSMDDFLFEKDFGTAAEPLKRDALCLFIGYEDQPERNPPDYNYTDMMFNIWVSPQVEQVIKPYTLFTLLTDQWWEQNPDNGLTGAPSHLGLATNSDPSTRQSETIFADNFNLLAYSPKDEFENQIYTMKVEEEKLPKEGVYFFRAKFDEDEGSLVFVPEVDENGAPRTDRPYYYTEDDVNNFLIHEYNKGEDVATEEGRAAARDRFRDIVPGIYELQEMPKRWKVDGVSQPILSGDDQENSSYGVLIPPLSIRQVAADVLGYKYQRVPVQDTYQFNPLTGTGGVELDPKWVSLGFLAGEFVQDTEEGTLSWKEPEAILHRQRDLEQADGTVTPVREFLTEKPEDAVAMCYVDYYTDTPEVRDEVEGIYGIKDKRFSIGFHRSGDDPRFAERYSQDHYEIVSLGKLGFNPYRETKSGKAIAKNTEDDPDVEDAPVFNYSFKYGTSDDYLAEEEVVPSFEFKSLIDGAGIMVVNGNLLVKDVFAYYGLLVVMGDVVITPTYRNDRFVYGADGNPMDAYGNSIYELGPGRWAYTWMDPNDSSHVIADSEFVLDDDGNKLVKDGGFVQVKPLYATGKDAYRGRLVVQGNLLVNGRIITETVRNQDAEVGAEDEFVIGELNCYGSDAAFKLSQDLADVHKDSIEVVSWTSSSNSSTMINEVKNLWDDIVD